MIGKKLSPILKEVEDTLWDFECHGGSKPYYDDTALRSASKIMMSVLMDKMWALQEDENMDLETRCAMATKAGNDFREFVKKYTNIDTHSLYK